MNKQHSLKCACILLFALADVSLFAAQSMKFKEVDKTSKPSYLKRSDKAWARATRIVGVIEKAPPSFTIKLFPPKEDKLLFSQDFSGLLTVYETRWLNPGKYDMIISANGYDDYIIRNLDLTVGTDCQIDIRFGTVEYTKHR